MTLYRRRRTETWQEVMAAALGAAAGAVIFYFARIWLQREPLEPGAGNGPPADAGRRGPEGEASSRR